MDYYPTNPAQETKQTNNNNKYILMIIIIIKRKKKKTEIIKLIKMTMEAILLMVSCHYRTMKMRNNSKTKHVEKNSNNNK